MKNILPAILIILAIVPCRGGEVACGDTRFSEYVPSLAGLKVGVAANHTAVVGRTHLVDTLRSQGVDVKAIFAPEHGFRGDIDAGDHVASYTDPRTGVPVVSLYGASRKPRVEDISRVDVILFDMQDVGVRFYTYISTLFYIMEQSARTGTEVVVLDRPNPNGYYTDGPVMDLKFRSFVGMLPIPVVHGMTLGELAQMINGEGWLPEGLKCKLRVVPCEGYRRSMRTRVTIAPSPNLKNDHAIMLYPSTCLFEATPMSVGRGTQWPFEVYGNPALVKAPFSFTPQDMPGAANPPLKGKLCRGYDLRDHAETCKLDLTFLITAYREMGKPEKFLTSFFEKLIGVTYVRQMILEGKSAEDIRARWKPAVDQFCEKRKPYLIYPD